MSDRQGSGPLDRREILQELDDNLSAVDIVAHQEALGAKLRIMADLFSARISRRLKGAGAFMSFFPQHIEILNGEYRIPFEIRGLQLFTVNVLPVFEELGIGVNMASGISPEVIISPEVMDKVCDFKPVEVVEAESGEEVKEVTEVAKGMGERVAAVLHGVDGAHESLVVLVKEFTDKVDALIPEYAELVNWRRGEAKLISDGGLNVSFYLDGEVDYADVMDAIEDVGVPIVHDPTAANFVRITWENLVEFLAENEVVDGGDKEAVSDTAERFDKLALSLDDVSESFAMADKKMSEFVYECIGKLRELAGFGENDLCLSMYYGSEKKSSDVSISSGVFVGISGYSSSGVRGDEDEKSDQQFVLSLNELHRLIGAIDPSYKKGDNSFFISRDKIVQLMEGTLEVEG